MLFLLGCGGKTSTLNLVIKLIWTFCTQLWWGHKKPGLDCLCAVHTLCTFCAFCTLCGVVFTQKQLHLGWGEKAWRQDTTSTKARHKECKSWAQRMQKHSLCPIFAPCTCIQVPCLCTLHAFHTLHTQRVTWWNFHYLILILLAPMLSPRDSLSSTLFLHCEVQPSLKHHQFHKEDPLVALLDADYWLVSQSAARGNNPDTCWYEHIWELDYPIKSWASTPITTQEGGIDGIYIVPHAHIHLS